MPSYWSSLPFVSQSISSEPEAHKAKEATEIPEHYRDTLKWKLLRQVHTAEFHIAPPRGPIKKGDKYVEYECKETGIIVQIELTLKDVSAVSGRLRTQKQSKEITVRATYICRLQLGRFNKNTGDFESVTTVRLNKLLDEYDVEHVYPLSAFLTCDGARQRMQSRRRQLLEQLARERKEAWKAEQEQEQWDGPALCMSMSDSDV
jgi:hypothetical protein